MEKVISHHHSTTDTNVTNTKLLCCQSNTSARLKAAVKPGTITANGDVAATTFNPFNTDINTVRGQETGYATLNPLIKSAALLYLMEILTLEQLHLELHMVEARWHSYDGYLRNRKVLLVRQH